MKPALAVGTLLAGAALYLFGGAVACVAAAPNPAAKESAYSALSSAFAAGKWEDALKGVEEFRKQFPSSDREAAASLIAAEANLKLRRLDAAEAEARRLLAKFPEANFGDRARLVLGQAAMIEGDWAEARKQLGAAIAFAADSGVVRQARLHLEELENFLQPPVRRASPVDSARIALILPLTGAGQSAGGEFLRGFLWRRRLDGFPDPLTLDSESDPVRAARLFRQCVEEQSINFVIGGVSDGEAAAMASLSEALQTTFLTTYCDLPGLASLSSYAIQGRSDQFKSGQALARYATEELLLRRFAIIYPSPGGCRQLVEGFRSAAIEGGGEVISEVAYFPNTIDFSGPLKQTREAAVRRSFNDSLRTVYEMRGNLLLDGVPYIPSGRFLQSLTAPSATADDVSGGQTLSTLLLDSLWQENYRRARRWMEATGREIDSVLIPTPSLDGVLIIVEPGKSEIMAPQLARYNLNRRVFGNDAWIEREVLKRIERYVEGMIVADPLGQSVPDSAIAEFGKGMAAAGDKALTRSHLAGERAARMAATSGKLGGKSLRDRIASINGLPTFTGEVVMLREERVTRKVPLFVITAGQAVPLDGAPRR